jgi:hypothetical protein
VLYGWAIGEELPPEPKYQFISAFDIHSIIVPNGTAFIKNLSGVKLFAGGRMVKDLRRKLSVVLLLYYLRRFHGRNSLAWFLLEMGKYRHGRGLARRKSRSL